VLKAGKAEGDLRELYRDKSIPESRGCPLDYRIADVIAFDGRGSDKIVVLLHKLSFGFEGQDARYLAVPARLSE
jgi:predicted secreted protein